MWSRLASTVYDEVRALDEAATNRLRTSLLIPPERFTEEMSAFQAWMDLAHSEGDNPVIVRAQVMTELYVTMVWLRDSLMRPVAAALPVAGTYSAVERFISGGQRRLLRNAVAHGRWCYLPGFDGLEYWAEPTRGGTHQRFEVSAEVLGSWQMLSRGTAIAVLLALTE
ncbi:MAG TPA: hypothetical protein VIR30_02640 [Nocardioides sp.]